MPSLICWKQHCKHIILKFTNTTTNSLLKNICFLKFSTTSSQHNDSETTNNSSDNSISEKRNNLLEPPEEPTTCCMSGCANCVWLDYAEQLCQHYRDGGEQAIREIHDRISDPNIKAYILHEIRMRNK